ncbi:ABC transporter permease [Gorillibacterium sp. sgz500922]|uniref:ABC transporter permease n=1 Tax=Gorillibacterium sp. sgz500922 TaxID=3446694 RepID=UPI003F67AE7C
MTTKSAASKRRMVNPVLGKEFRLRMRTLRSPLALLFYLVAFGGIALAFLYITRGINGTAAVSFNPSQSRELFYVLSVVQLGLIGFMTPGLTAGVISGEREKQTLNMLLTTEQSSTAIVLSKLASSLSFMLLLVLSTLPIYGIVFLYGGISPSQLGKVFLFYVFTMAALGSFGVLFSTIIKRTVTSVIVTYGTSLFLFGGTGILYLFFRQLMERSYYASGGIATTGHSWAGYVLGLNPVAALISLFQDGFSDSLFRKPGSSGASVAPIEMWQLYGIAMTILAIAAILLSIRFIRPSMGKRRR